MNLGEKLSNLATRITSLEQVENERKKKNAETELYNSLVKQNEQKMHNAFQKLIEMIADIDSRLKKIEGKTD